MVINQTATPPPDGPHRVVIIGSGFGGLFAVRALGRANVAVTMVDRTNHHLFQPLLYQVATGILSEGEIAPATREVLRRHKNTTILMAEITGIDLEHRTVRTQLDQPFSIPYDSLIVATGAQTSYFGHEEFSQWAPGMKTIDDALELRGRIFGAFEMAEAETDLDLRRTLLTFVVVGGGPSGVEMAGQIAELSRRALRRNFRVIQPQSARVVIVEGADKLLGSFGEKLSRQTARDLERMGVEVLTESMVVDMDADSVTIKHRDGTSHIIAASTKFWAAGVKASAMGEELARQSETELDRTGRVKVNPDCTIPGHPEVFVVGDLMALDDLPGVAEVAMQSGIYAALTIRRRLAGKTDDSEAKPFHYRDLGNLAVISRFRAVAQIKRLEIGGHIGWLIWLVVHITFLTGFKNRISALMHWAISFIGRSRNERTITTQQIMGRQSLAAFHQRLNQETDDDRGQTQEKAG